MKKTLLFGFVFAAACFQVEAEPGGTYALTGEEKGIEEIVKADMAQHPDLYKGVSARSYLAKFKRMNGIGKRKFSPGDVLRFPPTLASLSAKKGEAAAQEEKAAAPGGLPTTFKLRDLAQVVQEGSYCCPASGEVIARFHGIDTDQWEIAKLSSQDSMDNSGTNPLDMARALQNFGIRFRWLAAAHKSGDVDDFVKKTLPQFKKALVNEGPLYISIREIFGGNHGCVVIGYSDRVEKMYFYNPWGEEFNLSYKEVEKYTSGAIAFAPPKLLAEEAVDCTALIEALKQRVPNNAHGVARLGDVLRASSVAFQFVECNRADAMNDASLTARLARRESQKFIDLALGRVPAVLIPQTSDEGVTDYVLIRKAPESKKKLLVQRIGSQGWGEAELCKPDLLVRYWTTPMEVNGRKLWSLPLFELSGVR